MERRKRDLDFLLQSSAGSGRLPLPANDSEDTRRAHNELRPNQLLRWGNAAPLHVDAALALALCVWAAASGLPQARVRRQPANP